MLINKSTSNHIIDKLNTNKMARFKIGDTIRQLRLGQLYRKGTVVKGPFNVEGIDHYHVDWTWEAEPHKGKFAHIFSGPQIVADLNSKKYTIA